MPTPERVMPDRRLADLMVHGMHAWKNLPDTLQPSVPDFLSRCTIGSPRVHIPVINPNISPYFQDQIRHVFIKKKIDIETRPPSVYFEPLTQRTYMDLATLHDSRQRIRIWSLVGSSIIERPHSYQPHVSRPMTPEEARKITTHLFAEKVKTSRVQVINHGFIEHLEVDDMFACYLLPPAVPSLTTKEIGVFQSLKLVNDVFATAYGLVTEGMIARRGDADQFLSDIIDGQPIIPQKENIHGSQFATELAGIIKDLQLLWPGFLDMMLIGDLVEIAIETYDTKLHSTLKSIRRLHEALIGDLTGTRLTPNAVIPSLN